VARLCAEGDGLVVIDEAYHEFAGESVVPLLAEHENLVVLRTFSKAMSLAGLRVGYLLAHPALVREIDKARLPYNINFFSQVAALAVLEEKGEMEANVLRLRAAARRPLRGPAAPARHPRLSVARELHPDRARGPRAARGVRVALRRGRARARR
jgi:histidinol-phosphate aminotransferase